MAEKTFLESELQFSFPKDWVVIKYDEHRFYRYLSGSGLKGVDFIAIHQEQLILIEVKNYAIRFEKKNHIPVEALLADREKHSKRYLRKFEDSFRLLNVIGQYYQRKWWYRTGYQLFKRYFSEAYVLKRETGFWSKAIELLKQPEKVKLVLWLELPQDYSDSAAEELNDYFHKKLQSKIPAQMTLSIAHSKQSYGGIICQVI